MPSSGILAEYVRKALIKQSGEDNRNDYFTRKGPASPKEAAGDIGKAVAWPFKTTGKLLEGTVDVTASTVEYVGGSVLDSVTFGLVSGNSTKDERDNALEDGIAIVTYPVLNTLLDTADGVGYFVGVDECEFV